MELKDIKEQYKDCYLIYNRRSTDDADNQRNSLTYQRLCNFEYAKNRTLTMANLTIPGFCTNGIIDESHSAFKQEEEFTITTDGAIQYRILRPKFLTMIGLLQSRKVKGVIFLCWDRASRNEQDDMVIKKLMNTGSDIRFVDTTYEKTSAGKLHMRVDGMFSAHYSDVISEKVRRAQRKLRDEGKCLYATPIGYLDMGSDNKPFDPVRAPIVKRIFEQYATGNWSVKQISDWAREQGLTNKACRRKRTKEEIADNVDVQSIPKISRPVDYKTVESILPNPFYIGKIKVGNTYESSTAHQALIDNSLFFQVQEILKQKRTSVYYINKQFQTYREMARCECGRAYSPYEQKGIIYYRTRCKAGCTNANPNLSESDITKAIQSVLDDIYLTDAELQEIENGTRTELAKISEHRDSAIADLQKKQRTIMADIDYITQNRITLLRTASMDADAIKEEMDRLEGKLRLVAAELTAYSESAPEMLRYVVSFSQIAKDAGLFFKFALDSEKRELTSIIFTELIFKG
jgi:site-specific DNA recombinase